MAQGFSQRPGVDFDETYAPVVAMSTLSALLSFAASREWIIEVDDVQTAYLNGKVDEKIYIKEPTEFDKGGE